MLLLVNNFWSNSYIEYKSKGDRKTLSVKKYLNKIRPYLKDIINSLRKSGTWEIYLIITMNFISFRDDNDEELVMHSKSDNGEIMINDIIEIMINDETNNFIRKVFHSRKNRYQNNLQKKN